MAPFRPTNLNKRLYPGNANVIGPTCRATIGFTTTTCCSCISNVCGAAFEVFTLGCRSTSCCCPYCNCCCCCVCTVCDRTVPSGMWKASEQYEARTRDAWGDDSCSNAAAIGYCSACCGNLGPSAGNDCKGFYFCCQGGTAKWFVAPSCNEVGRFWNARNDAVTVANSNMGSCGWFVPAWPDLQSGYNCRSYWDTYSVTCYWSDSIYRFNHSTFICFDNGGACRSTYNKSSNRCVRAFRCTAG